MLARTLKMLMLQIQREKRLVAEVMLMKAMVLQIQMLALEMYSKGTNDRDWFDQTQK